MTKTDYMVNASAVHSNATVSSGGITAIIVFSIIAVSVIIVLVLAKLIMKWLKTGFCEQCQWSMCFGHKKMKFKPKQSPPPDTRKKHNTRYAQRMEMKKMLEDSDEEIIDSKKIKTEKSKV